MKEELMRRISAALDSADGLAGDPALQEELRSDPEGAKYTKDVTRVGKWLATWPLPEPDDAAFEALAARIEQRLDEPLGAITDPTAPPAFEDDDALRDATASLLQSGEYRVSDSAIVLLASDPAIPVPAEAAAPPSEPKSPIAKVALGKARVPSIVEEHSGTGEPLSAADLEQRLVAKGETADKPKKKKKKKPDGEVAAAGAVSTRAKSSDRISIPTPKPSLGAPSLSPVVQLPKTEEKKPATLWWFAAAAAIGLGVFGAATLFEGQAAPTADRAQGSTLVTTGTVMPAAVAVAAEPTTGDTVAAAPPPVAPTDVVDPVAGLEDRAAPAEALRPRPPATIASASPMPAPYAPARIAAPTHASAGGRTGMGGGGGDDLAEADLEQEPASTRRRVAGTGASATGTTTASAAGPTTAPATSAPTPTPRPEPAEAAPTARAATPAPHDDSLPETPDRSTIQAVLSARTEAVAACANGAHGLADIDVVIASSGRITTATVNGPFAGTPIGSCMARAIRGATFPPFSQPRFEVTYPYHL